MSEHAVIEAHPVISSSSSSQSSSSSPSTHSFLIQVCNMCDQEMELVAGDIIYGDGWYHGSCWLKADEERRVQSYDVQKPLIIIDD
jgi:hypothetical protein